MIFITLMQLSYDDINFEICVVMLFLCAMILCHRPMTLMSPGDDPKVTGR